MGEDFQDCEDPDAFRDEELDEPEQFPGQHHETEGSQAEAERREEFRKDITVEQLTEEHERQPSPGSARHYRGLVRTCPEYGFLTGTPKNPLTRFQMPWYMLRDS